MMNRNKHRFLIAWMLAFTGIFMTSACDNVNRGPHPTTVGDDMGAGGTGGTGGGGGGVLGVDMGSATCTACDSSATNCNSSCSDCVDQNLAYATCVLGELDELSASRPRTAGAFANAVPNADFLTECKCGLLVAGVAVAIAALIAAVILAWPFITALAGGAALTAAATAAITKAAGLALGIAAAIVGFIKDCGGTAAAATVCAGFGLQRLAFEAALVGINAAYGTYCIVPAPVPASCAAIKQLYDGANKFDADMKTFCGF